MITLSENFRALFYTPFYAAQATGAYARFVVSFNAGTATSVTLHIGFYGPGSAAWEEADDVSLCPVTIPA